MMIVVSGMDGTGKTTISMNLMRKFARFGVPTMYVHGFSNPILSRFPALSMLFKTDHKKMLSQQSYKVKEGFPHNIVLCFWHFIVFVELLLYATYVRQKNRKHIIIFDRFWYDRYAYVLARSDDFILLRLIYTKLFQIIKPDISVFLKVGCTTAKERKENEHDYSLNFYEKLSNSYEFVYTKILKKSVCIRINTEKTSSDFIANEIIKSLFGLHRNIFSQTFAIARKNRLEYGLLHFLSFIGFESLQVLKLRELCEKKKQKIKKALHYVSRFNSLGFDGLLFKSHNVCTITLPNDIDILLNSNSKPLLLKFSEMSENVRISVKSPWELEIFIPSAIEIEIAPHVMWYNTQFVSDEVTFKSPKKVTVLGLEVLTTNDVCDFLSRCAHALFNHFCLRFDEYLHILAVSKTFNEQERNLILNEVNRMGWKEGYVYFLNELNKIQAIMNAFKDSRLDSGFKTPIFPYTFPYVIVTFFFLKIVFSRFRNGRLTLTELCGSVLQFFKHTFFTYFYRIGDTLIAWIKEV